MLFKTTEQRPENGKYLFHIQDFGNWGFNKDFLTEKHIWIWNFNTIVSFETPEEFCTSDMDLNFFCRLQQILKVIALQPLIADT